MTLEEKRIEAKRLMAQEIMDNEAPILQESHPDVSFLDRFTLKNTDATPEESINYLKNKYPGLQGKVVGDQVLLKKKNEAAWRALDPSGFDLQDISDVVGMIPEGAAQIAGGAFGGTIGAAAGGVGAVGGLMAGSGLASAGTNLVKQGIKNALGISDEINPKEAAISGGISAFAAPLFGGVGGKALEGLKPGIAKALAGRGALGTGYDVATRKVAPKIAEFMSGGTVPTEAFKFMASKPEKIAEIAKDPLLPGKQVAEQLGMGIQSKLNSLKPAYAEVAKSEIPISLEDVGKKLLSSIEVAAKNVEKAPGNQALSDTLASLQKIYNDHFMVGNAPLKDTTVDVAYSLKQSLGDILDKQGDTKVGRQVFSGISDAKTNIGKKIDTALEGTPFELPNKEYGETMRDMDLFKKYFEGNTAEETALKSNRALSRMTGNKQKDFKKAVSDLGNKYGVDLNEQALAQQTYQTLENPSFMPKLNAGMLGNFAIRSGIGAAAGSPWGSEGAALGALIAAGGTTPGLLKQYFRAGKGLESLAKKVPGAKSMGRQYITDLLNERASQ